MKKRNVLFRKHTQISGVCFIVAMQFLPAATSRNNKAIETL